MSSPQVSVLMPVFNGLPYLAQAIDSILAQTFEDFELVIVDDGSADGSREVLEQYAARDRRIRLILNGTNVGIARALNAGIGECRGAYIARMDADDVALPQRLKLQVDFMDRSPTVGVCGTRFTRFGYDNRDVDFPLTDGEIKVHHLLSDTALCHPSVLVRRSLLVESGIKYRPEDVPAEDLWLWIRLGFTTRLANLPEKLLLYRTHASQSSVRAHAPQRERATAARAAYAESILSRPLSEPEKRAHEALSGDTIIASSAELDRVTRYAANLVSANAAAGAIDPACLREAVDGCVKRLPVRYAEARYKYSRKFDLALLSASLRDPLRPLFRLRLHDTLRFVAKCVIGHIPRTGAA